MEVSWRHVGDVLRVSWGQKVSENVNTFEKVISKVKKTDGFLKVAC